MKADLRRFGYTQGNYRLACADCGLLFPGDAGAVRCETCAKRAAEGAKIVSASGFSFQNGTYRVLAVTQGGSLLLRRPDGRWSDITPDPEENVGLTLSKTCRTCDGCTTELGVKP